jgi:hypothetical protein
LYEAPISPTIKLCDKGLSLTETKRREQLNIGVRRKKDVEAEKNTPKISPCRAAWMRDIPSTRKRDARYFHPVLRQKYLLTYYGI